jgi:WD40 repeat protein
VALPAAPLHALRFAGSGADAPLLGIGAAGVWRLPAAPGAAPDWPCPTAPGQPLALDRAGRRLALAHPASQGRFGVCVIDLTRPGQPGWDRPLHRRDIRALSFSADGRLLLTASRDGSALVLDSASGEERLALPPGGPLGRPLNDADFDPQGQRIALAAADEQIYLYDLKGRRLALLGTVERRGERLRVHRTAVRQAAFSADGRWLLAGDDEGQVVRWGLADGEAEVLGHHRLSVTGLEVTDGPDPTEGEPLVLSASLDRTARLWGQDSGREVAVFSHRAAVARVRFSTDDRRVLTDSELDGSARVWSVEPSSRLAYRLPQGGHVWHLAMAAAPPGLALGPGELLIASGSFDGSVLVRRWDPNTSGAAPAEVWRLAGHRGRVRRVAFSPTARQLASAAYDGSVRVWDLETGTGCALNLGSASGPPIEVYRALFAPDGGWLLSASNDPSRPVRLWDPAACTEIALPPALDHGQSRVQAAAVTTAPDGAQLVATGNEAGDLRAIRRGRDGRWSRLCQLAASWKPIEDLAFSPDGTTLAAVGEDGRAALVGLSEGDCGEPRYLEGGTGALYSVAFAPDGQALVTSAVDGRAQVWDLAGHRLADLHGHKDRIYNADFSPDGRWLLTASRDGTLRLWERPPPTPPAGEVPVLRSYLMLDAELGGAAYARFSPDGNAIAAAYWENAAVLWRLWSEDPSPDPALERVWGKDRSRLALIREAVRFRRDNRLDVAEDPATGD